MSHVCGRDIKCPYCDHVFSDSWKYRQKYGGEIECASCGKAFSLVITHTVAYSTYKLVCKDGQHDFGEPTVSNISQTTADEWNRDRFLGETDHKPHSVWSRRCHKCEEVEHEVTELHAPHPWTNKVAA